MEPVTIMGKVLEHTSCLFNTLLNQQTIISSNCFIDSIPFLRSI